MNAPSKTAKKLLGEPVDESYSRVAQIMRGIVPSVRSLGILTAEHPLGLPLSAEENRGRNAELEKQLKSGHYGFHKIQGRYGNFENPFFVPNINRSYLLRLATEHGQQAFIYGFSAYQATPSFDSMTFEFHRRADEQSRFGVVGTRKVFISAENEKDNYSKVDGVKFVIPFFDAGYEGAEFAGGTVLKKANLPNTPKVESLIAEIETALDGYFEHEKEGMAMWGTRGVVNTRLRQLRDISKGIIKEDSEYL